MTGPELRDLRTAHGLTLHELADRLGVHWVTVWRWEQAARVGDDVAARCRAALGEAKDAS